MFCFIYLSLLFPAFLDAFTFSLFPRKYFGGVKLHGEDGDNFDGNEFNEVLKAQSSVWGKYGAFSNEKNKEIFDAIRKEQEARAEDIYRKYPFDNISLPILPDCNNYYSGKFGDYFWHQNADQVYVYIPIDETVSKNDIKANFEAKKVTVYVKSEEVIEFECLERIIPDGSFWVMETDKKSNSRYIQLDLEKRFRMINWKSLFGEAIKEEVEMLEKSRQSEMLKKLFSANKGVSKLTGIDPETIEEMQKNPDLYNMLSGDIDTTPRIVDTDTIPEEWKNKIISPETESDVEQAFKEALNQYSSRDDKDDERNNGDENIIDIDYK
jgi:hypothetical protein